MSHIKDLTLPIAMVLGVLCYRWLYRFTPITPYLIFVMLFFTFCKVDIRAMKIQRWHGLLLAFQLIASVALFFLLRPLNLLLAQGIMLCVLMPTATAAAVITGKLGGSVEQLTTYTLLSNFAVALFVPAFFPMMHPDAHISFAQGFLTILSKVFPLLIGPFVAAFLLRITYMAIVHKPLRMTRFFANLPFYLWAFSLVILMANTTHSLIYEEYDIWAAVVLAVGSLCMCLLQFVVGRRIGKRYSATISAGQALGQKNTILGIWMAHTYLLPLSALGPAAYIIWQNVFNSWQLWKSAAQKRVQERDSQSE